MLNLRKERDPRTGVEEWIDKVENHLGLSKTYAKLAEMIGGKAEQNVSNKFHVFTETKVASVYADRRERSVTA